MKITLEIFWQYPRVVRAYWYAPQSHGYTNRPLMLPPIAVGLLMVGNAGDFTAAASIASTTGKAVVSPYVM